MKKGLKRWRIITTLLGVAACFAATAVAQDSSTEPAWPRELDGEIGTVIIYQPQLESFAGNTLEARAAVSVTEKGKTTPVFGAMWFKSRVSTDMDTRLVLLEQLSVTAAKFPDTDDAEVQKLSSFLETEVPQWHMELSLDRLLASVAEMDQQYGGDHALNNDAPEVIYVDHPTVLILIDGEPKLADLENSDLKYVMNTPYYMLQEPKSKQYYLKGGAYWYMASDIMGEWTTTSDLPKSVADVAKQVAEDEKKQAAEAAQQGEDVTPPEEVGDSPVPKIVVRTAPAELIEVTGAPAMAPIAGTELLYVENSESDIVFDISTQKYYILLSGRWYESSSMTDNKWVFVPPDKVPADFAKIPAESDMGQVLTSVAGTQESKEAVLENQIPQTAEIDRKTATVTVTYDGDPKFEKCSDAVAYAVNTDKSVLLVNGTYYCCDQAIWFVANGPQGPWQVATSVPPEIQDIPPDCPAYNVKYVYIYDSTPEVVYVAYTPAYTGAYVYGGCVVYGTGFVYHPWYGRYYYPPPVTWGFHAHWNPVTGWGFSFGVSYGWLHIGFGRPWVGGWWGPAGYRHGYRHGYHQGYRHGYHQGARAGYRAGYQAGKRQSQRNMYRSRQGQGVNRTGTNPGRGQTAKKQPKASKQPNNVYAGKNGSVQRNQGGQWQQKNKSGWSSSQGTKNMQSSSQSRNRGNQRASQSRSSQSRSRGGGGGRRR